MNRGDEQHGESAPEELNHEDSRIEALLDRYYFLVEQGETPEIEEICRDAPELLDRFARLVAAQSALLGDTIGSDPDAVQAPEQVGPYRIGEALGSGGMGVVYRATDEEGREVALKLLRPELASDSSRRLRFRREARITAAIEHPNIVPVLDTGVVDGHCYLAMRLLDGQTLDKVGDTIDEREAARLGAKIAHALHSAHEVGVVHRDVKPGNLLLEHGDPFLLNFGLARNRLDWALTRDGHMPGTLAYMAPEQLRGDSEQIGPRADIYALGATLHQLVTGTPPFDDTTPEALMRSVLVDRPQLGRRTGHSPAFARIVEKALEKDPRDRFESAQEFAEELQRFADGSSILTRSRPWRLRIRRQFRRYPKTFGLAAVALIAIGWLGGERMLDRARRTDDYTQRIAAIEIDLAEGRHHQALVRLGDLDLGDSVVDRQRVTDLKDEALGRRLLDQLWDLLLAERNLRDVRPLDQLAARLREESPVVAKSVEARLAGSCIELMREDPDALDTEDLIARFADPELVSAYPRTTSLAPILLRSEPDGNVNPGRDCDDYVFAALLRQLLAARDGSVRDELTRALTLEPADRRANLLDAHLLHREGNLVGSRTAMRALLRPDDPRPETELWIAYAAMRQFDFDASSRWIESATTRHEELGDSAPFRIELAWIRLSLKQGRYGEVRTRMAEARSRYGASDWLTYYEAQILGREARFEDARKLYEQLATSSEVRKVRVVAEVGLLDLDSVAAANGERTERNSPEQLIRRADELTLQLTTVGDRTMLSQVQRVKSFAHFERGERDLAVSARESARKNDPLHPVPMTLLYVEANRYPESEILELAATETLSWLEKVETAYVSGAPRPRDAHKFAVVGSNFAARAGDPDLGWTLLEHAERLEAEGAHVDPAQARSGASVRAFLEAQSPSPAASQTPKRRPR